MARSYKKTPALTDTGRPFHRYAKREANAAVRRFKGDLSSGGSYKKLYESWDICDWKYIYTPRRYRRYIERTWDLFEKGTLRFNGTPKFPDEKSVRNAINKPRRK